VTRPNIRGPVSGINCLLGVNSYGSYGVRVTRISYGLEILSSESEARNTRAFYPTSNSEPGFTLTMVFLDTQERDAFNAWVRGYWDAVSANSNIGGFMTVTVPSRNFVRQGVPSQSIIYGASWDEVSIPATISFVGTLNPIDAVGVGDTIARVGSYYVKATTDLQNGLFFNPLDIQVGGSTLEGTLYNGVGRPADNVVAAHGGNIYTADGGTPVGGLTPYVPPPLSTGDTNRGER
jgi:hypothetical protein